MKSAAGIKKIQALLLIMTFSLFTTIGCGGGGGGGQQFPPTIAPAINLPKTGQVISYDTNTVKRDDGALQMGVAWPDPRFSVASSGTGTVVTDQLTGLMWPSDAGTPTFTGASSTCTGGTMTWQGALNYVACLNANNYLGYNDWRLPNRKELWSLVHKGQVSNVAWLGTMGFSNLLLSTSYWSSTSYAGTTAAAWCVSFYYGVLDYDVKSSALYVWPVRVGGVATADLPETGQSNCYDSAYPANEIPCTGTGQDGEKRAGIAWPGMRFTLTSSGTGNVVVDNLTGLMWPQDAGTPTVDACASGVKAWQDALNYVACLNFGSGYLGYSDWRMPNVNELESLIHAGYNEETCSGSPCVTNAAWLNTQGFSNVQAGYYWTSTSYAGFTEYAWIVYLNDGRVYDHYKATSNYVWPVRGGQ